MENYKRKLLKLLKLVRAKPYRKALRHGVAASVEHEALVRSLPIKTVLDIGANVGQFSVMLSAVHPSCDIIAFEPLSKAYEKLQSLFENNTNFIAFHCAVGEQAFTKDMNVSGKIDSSSLLEISEVQAEKFPGTSAVGLESVSVKPISEVVDVHLCQKPVFVKIDVQGYELNVLSGMVEQLQFVEYVYVECSYIELYVGQSLAQEVIELLVECDFVLIGVYNTSFDDKGIAVQSDFLFQKKPQSINDDNGMISDVAV